MTKKAMKLLFVAQLKAAIWYIVIYALVVGGLSVVFHYVKDVDQDWMIISAIYSPKIYMLIMGIIYPLVTMELFLSRGLTRKQYFCALSGAVGFLSLILIIPPIIAEIIMGIFTPLSVVINLVQMPLFFLIGWTAVVGFQFGKWYQAALGIICAVACVQILNSISTFQKIPGVVELGVSLLLVIAQTMLLPGVIRRIPIKI